MFLAMLYLIPFLHQTTTLNLKKRLMLGCILFHFYIKPQLWQIDSCVANVVSYSISTSNHNHNQQILSPCGLYLIPFLHQTTTYA